MALKPDVTLSIVKNADNTDNRQKLYSVLKERSVRYAVANREDNDWEKETCPKDVVIPSQIEGKNVTSIGGWGAFSWKYFILSC